MELSQMYYSGIGYEEIDMNTKKVTDIICQ